MENIFIGVFGIILLIMFIYFVYQIEKSDNETQKYIDEHYHKYGEWDIRYR